MDDDQSTEPRLSMFVSRASQIRQLLAVGQVTRAKELAAQQIADAPDDPSSYLSLVSILLREGDANGAIAAAEEAVRLDPEYAVAWQLRASALFRGGRFAAAEESLLEAIRLEPDEAVYFERYAQMLSFCGRNAQALEIVQVALELDPDDESAHALFASLLHQVHPTRWRVSEEAARRAIELNPEDADSFAILGVLLMSQRKFAEAEEHFRTALQLDAMNQLALRGLGQVVMAKNILYRPFMGYALMMERLGAGVQFMVVGSLWAIASVLRAATAEPVSTFVTVGYLALCAYTWFATPIVRAILKRKYPWI